MLTPKQEKFINCPYHPDELKVKFRGSLFCGGCLKLIKEANWHLSPEEMTKEIFKVFKLEEKKL